VRCHIVQYFTTIIRGSSLLRTSSIVATTFVTAKHSFLNPTRPSSSSFFVKQVATTATMQATVAIEPFAVSFRVTASVSSAVLLSVTDHSLGSS
jgi:hypothetical protein